MRQESDLQRGRHFNRHGGFTLIELLVVIAIIVVLVGLLVPAVQKVRAAAARTQCANNLKQIGLALQNYHDTQKSFPSGYVSNYDLAGNDTGPGWGWAAFILPQMEQQNLYDAIQLNQNIEAPANSGVRVRPVQSYLCPGDAAPLTWMAKNYDLSGNPVTTICDVASANYIGVYGSVEPGVDGDGTFFRDSHVRIGDITDGSSNTIIVGERSFRLGPATWVGAVTSGNMFPPPGSPAPPVLENASGMVLGHTGDGNGPGSPDSYVNQFSSQHSGGVNFLFADGHVGFLQTSMNYAVYKALSTRQGGGTSGRRLLMRYVLMLLILAVLVIGCESRPKGENVALDKVPETVMKVANEKLPDVKFEQAWKTPNGNYEVRGKAKNGKVRDIQIKPNGDVVEID